MNQNLPIDALAAVRMRWPSVDGLLRTAAQELYASDEQLAMMVVARSEGMPDEVIEWVLHPYNQEIPGVVRSMEELVRLGGDTDTPDRVDAFAAVRMRWPSVDGLLRSADRWTTARSETERMKVVARSEGMSKEVVEWVIAWHGTPPSSVSTMSELVEMAKTKGEGQGTGKTQGGR